MVNETIFVRIGTAHPEDNPALAGCCPPPVGRVKPLADAVGQPLLPRIARALRNGIVKPAPLSGPASRKRSVRDAGAADPAIDPQRLAADQERGRPLRSVVVREMPGRALHALGRALRAGWTFLARSWQPVPSPLSASKLAPYGKYGPLDVPPNYEERRAQFYGRGL